MLGIISSGFWSWLALLECWLLDSYPQFMDEPRETSDLFGKLNSESVCLDRMFSQEPLPSGKINEFCWWLDPHPTTIGWQTYWWSNPSRVQWFVGIGMWRLPLICEAKKSSCWLFLDGASPVRRVCWATPCCPATTYSILVLQSWKQHCENSSVDKQQLFCFMWSIASISESFMLVSCAPSFALSIAQKPLAAVKLRRSALVPPTWEKDHAKL